MRARIAYRVRRLERSTTDSSMKRWRVEFQGRAEDDLARLDRTARRRIITGLYWLTENFDEVTPLSLGGEWKGFFKFRVGDWRTIYTG